jgi:hypothetical protein
MSSMFTSFAVTYLLPIIQRMAGAVIKKPMKVHIQSYLLDLVDDWQPLALFHK